MLICSSELSLKERYHVLTQGVVPRPIAWVLTDNGIGERDSCYNLAPFSFFTMVSAEPPLLMLAITRKSGDESTKDTQYNLEKNKFATIHICDRSHLDWLLDSATELPHGESELLRKPYKLIDEVDGFLPRIDGVNVAFFCKFDHIHVIEGCISTLVFCRVVYTYISDNVGQINNGKVEIDPLKLRPLARLGKRTYTESDNLIVSDHNPAICL